MEKVWTKGHQQSEAAGHLQGFEREAQTAKKHISARQGDHEKRKGRLPPGEEVLTRSEGVLPFENGFLFF